MRPVFISKAVAMKSVLQSASVRVPRMATSASWRPVAGYLALAQSLGSGIHQEPLKMPAARSVKNLTTSDAGIPTARQAAMMLPTLVPAIKSNWHHAGLPDASSNTAMSSACMMPRTPPPSKLAAFIV